MVFSAAAGASLRRVLLLLTLALAALPLSARAAGVYVSPSGSDAAPGTSAKPKRTLQAAITVAATGDKVLLAPGTYTGPGNVDLDFGGKSLTLAAVGTDPSKTVIDCAGSAAAPHRALYLHSGEGLTAPAGLAGLTLRNGGGVDAGGALRLDSGSLTVQNCIFQNNAAAGGGAVASAGTLVLTGCTFTGSQASGNGSALYNSGTLTLTNCVMTQNQGVYATIYNDGTATLTHCTSTLNINTGPYGYRLSFFNGSRGTGQLLNSIFYGDKDYEVYSDNFYRLIVSHCDVHGSYYATSAGNFDADPRFVNPAAGDLHLRPGSPCVKAGDPSASAPTDKDGKTRANPPAVGAYEGQTAATSTRLVSGPSSARYGQTVTLTATVSYPAASSAVSTGTVVFSEGKTVLGSAPLTAGRAALSVSTFAVGSHTLTAAYSGTSNLGASYGTASQNVVKATTKTTLVAAPNPSGVGQTVNLTATVANTDSSAIPVGTITFTDNGKPLGVGTLNNAGQSTLSTSALTLSRHNLLAAYRPTANFSASVSATLTQVVTKSSTTVTLTSSLNPSAPGQRITLTTTVVGVGKMPTGVVVFTDKTEDKILAAVILSNATVAIPISSLALGSHQIVVTYAGDAANNTSVSAALTQVVAAYVNPLYISPTGSDANPGTQAAPKLTIQAAINTALSGDTVIVEDGTYTGPGDVDLDFGGKNLTVTSQNGAASTIIDCGGSSSANHRGFYLHSGETAAVIRGLTIQNGYEVGNGDATGGGAIFNSSVGATVQNCIIKNSSSIYGGGIHSENSSSATIAVINCLLVGNRASYGGGLYDYNSGSGKITATGCTLMGNIASASGGGLYNINDDAGNLANNSGLVSITNCTFTGNAAIGGNPGAGGGLYNSIYSGTASVTNCTFTGNIATVGGGIDNYSYLSTIAVTNCTLTGNSAQNGNDGGVYNSSFGGSITLINDILYGDKGGELNGGVVSNCDIQGGFIGTANINADPLFSDAPSDLHLTAGSPCLGAGTAGGAPAATLDGQTRPLPPSMGAYEAGRTGTMPTITVLASSLNPSTVGQSIIFTATVTAQEQTPTGTLTVSADGVPMAHLALNGGKTVYSTSALTSGSHSMTAIYSGDANFSPGKSVTLTQTVNTIPTTTTLTSSLNPSAYGQSVTFTAAVTGGSPTGSVTFNDMTTGAVLGVAYQSGGTTLWTMTVSNLSGGSHQIVATYSGDGSYSASASAALTQIVHTADTTAVLVASINPSISSQAITFAASVTGIAGTPTGTVTFIVDGTAQATVTLGNGSYAAYTTSSLAVGPHTVTANYSGDANFTASTSAPLTQTVVAHISPQYVSPTGSDANAGTQAAPKLTIQAAINTALSGDTVIVGNGTYTGPGDVDLDFGGRNLTVASQHGASSTVIDCGGSSSAYHRGFYLHSGETAAVIRGLTIQNGYQGNGFGFGGSGGGMYNFRVGLTIESCIFKNNTAIGGGGGGLYNYMESGYPITLTNCILIGNSASYGGGVYAATVVSPLTLTNCTLTGNTALPGNGGGVFCYNLGYPADVGTIILTNDILYGDTGGECGYQGTALVASFSDILGGYSGPGNFSADPLFVNAATGDLHLKAGSPCRAAGTATGAPATDKDGTARANPPSVGAYE